MPKGFELEFGIGAEARDRRDAKVATLPWPPADERPEGHLKGWFSQAEEALQELHGMDNGEASLFKGRTKGPRTITVPLEAKVHANRMDRASPLTQLWLSLRHMARRRWHLGLGGQLDGYKARSRQQLYEVALERISKFQAQGVTMFDGTIFDTFWDAIAHQSDMGYQLLAMTEQIVGKHTKEDIHASKLKWDEFTDEAFERQVSIAH